MFGTEHCRPRRLTRRLTASLTVVVTFVLTMSDAEAQQTPPTRFRVFARSSQVGTEEIGVTRSPDGWTISGNGRLGNVVGKRLEITYDPDWKPLTLALDATAGGQQLVLRIVVENGTAQSELWQGTDRSTSTDTVDPRAVLLPNPFFGAYAALAARVHTAAPDAHIAIYQGQGSSFDVTVGASVAERVQTVERLIETRRTRLGFALPGSASPLEAELWTDEEGRLLRLTVPSQSIDVVRDDLSAVSTRRVLVDRAGDQQVRIAANGFSLAATLSTPAGTDSTRRPAVILVGGSGPADRDETVANIPIFGQLAGTLADAGFIVLRYDKRGVGQSGGRPEAATLADYSEDLRAAVKFMGARKDVDPRRLAVVGHSEGGAVGMLAAARDKRIRALALLATIGVTGAELNLAQVTRAMSRSTQSEADKQATIDLQKRIQAAVMTGAGWDGVPAHIRLQAEVPWFQSFLLFDPAKTMADIRQPILVVQGLLDTQVPPSNADRLEALAKSRKHKSPVDVARIAGVNHLLVPATTGEVEEYGSLKDVSVSPDVSGAIARWLEKTFGAASQ